MKGYQSTVVTFMVLITTAFLFTNLGLIRSDNCPPEAGTINTQSFPVNLAALNDTELSQLRLHLDRRLGLPAIPIAKAPPLKPAQLASMTNLHSIRSRRNRPLPACSLSGRRAKTFLIVFMGHSGSTAIVTELRNHSQVSIAASEPVDHQNVFDTNSALTMARSIFDHGVKNGKTVGFKIRPNHILNDPAAWRKLTSEYETRIIWQYRKNLFKASVGEYTSRVLNDTSVIEGLSSNISREERCSIGAGCRFRINDFSFLHENLRSMIRSQRLITDAVVELSASGDGRGEKGCVREIPYEDYLYDRVEAMSDIMQFLGLRHEPTKPDRFKATSDSMCEAIENWDEVCDKLYGCVLWQHMLEDVRNGCYCKMSGGFPISKYCDIF